MSKRRLADATPVGTPETTPWPYPDIVRMTAHRGSGQWRKRYAGKDFYFGPLSDPAGSLANWRRDWPVIIGQRPAVLEQAKPSETVTLKEACRVFLTAKKAQVKSGDIVWVTFREYLDLCRFLCRTIRGRTRVRDIGPAVFSRLKGMWSGLKPTTRRNKVVKVRSIFGWLAKQKVIDPVDFGADFEGPSDKVLRLDRESSKVARLFSPDEIKDLLRVCETEPWRVCKVGLPCPTVRCALLLGLSCGMGQSDLASLRWSEIDLKGEMIERVRSKTGSPQRSPLWPETIAALSLVPRAGDLVFVNERGSAVVRRGADDIARAVQALGLITGTPRRFYDLRRTFATIGSEVGDDHAVKLIMGQRLMGVLHEHYVLRFPIKRLRKVSDHVRAWYQSASSKSGS